MTLWLILILAFDLIVGYFAVTGIAREIDERERLLALILFAEMKDWRLSPPGSEL